MIDEKELAAIQDINRRLPFAEPIEQGETAEEYAYREMRELFYYA